MKSILQIEFSPGILEDRAAILRRYGCMVMSVLGFDEAQAFNPLAHNVGVVAIGHGAPREEREQLISLFREKVPNITIVCHGDIPMSRSQKPILMFPQTTLSFRRGQLFKLLSATTEKQYSRDWECLRAAIRELSFPWIMVTWPNLKTSV